MGHGADLVTGIDDVANIVIGRRNLHRLSGDDGVEFLQSDMLFLRGGLTKAVPDFLLVLRVQVITEFLSRMHDGFNRIVHAQQEIAVLCLFLLVRRRFCALWRCRSFQPGR